MFAIESMSKEELRELNRKVVERINYLHQMEAQDKMSRLYFGDTVSFTNNDGNVVTGKIQRFNQKSVTVICPHGHSWRVSPQLIKKIPTGVLSAPFQVVVGT